MDNLIINNLRVSYRILARRVHHTVVVHTGNAEEIARQNMEVLHFAQAMEAHAAQFSANSLEELNTARRSITTMLELLSRVAQPVGEPTPAAPAPSGPRQMHCSFEIPEIVRLIVSHLNPLSGDGRSLAVLARTCTIFHDPALDLLWRHQDTILNLLHYMPNDPWRLQRHSGVDTLRLNRPIEDGDWDRPLQYSRRIRSLVVKDFYPRLTQGFQAVAVSFRPDYLLPNLQTLTWMPSVDDYAYISLFLGPRITSLHLPSCKTDIRLSLLPTIARRYPNLFDVSIGYSAGTNTPSASTPVEQSRLSVFVQGLRTVKSLRINSLDIAAIGYLGSLSTLETLSVALSATSLTSLADRALFCNLRSICLSCYDGDEIGLATQFLRALSDPPLTSVDLNLGNCPTAEAAEKLFLTLAEHSSHASLNTLLLKCEPEDLPEFSPEEYGLPLRALKPLFCFTNLVHVSIMTPVGYLLDDGAVSELAVAWPNIEELHLQALDHKQHTATIVGLKAFAKHCPKLRTLEMPFNALAVVLPTLRRIEERVRILHPALVSLDVAQSPIDNALEVAREISGSFYNLRTILTAREDHCNEVLDTTDPAEAIQIGYHLLWKEVESFVPSLSDMRAEEFHLGAMSIERSEYFPFDLEPLTRV
ncbi:hypothetical protein B0H16DRAFT_1432351 [Mycena metata]|uniref:F-box domain-containing protein n=1 Tax=Mycena metata TaxID=1033252 RepID=A0AAD7HGX7_9AGAR|nr:hypothetical protein B0H16DRAFT_1432351 [Mycena metata]